MEESPAVSSSDIRQKLLEFQNDIVSELLEADGVAVLGKGLGMHSIVAAILAIHELTESSGGVVIVIGTPMLILN